MKTVDDLKNLYDYALNKGLCVNKTSFCELIGSNPSNMSRLFSDSSTYNYNRICERAQAAIDMALEEKELSSRKPDAGTISAPTISTAVTMEQLTAILDERDKKWMEQLNTMKDHYERIIMALINK